MDNAGRGEQDVELSGGGGSDSPTALAPFAYALPAQASPASGAPAAPAEQEGGSAAPATTSSLGQASPTESSEEVTAETPPPAPEELSPPPKGIAGILPGALPFESLELHKASAPRSVTLTNTGNALLEIRSITTSKADFTQTNNCGFSLPAEASCTIQVTFKPSKTGRIDGYLKIDAGTDPPRQVLRKPQFVLDERLVDQQLCRGRGQLHRPPLLHLLLQRPEVPLHPIDADGQAVFQREVLGMLREHGSVFPVKRKVFANKDSQLCAATKYAKHACELRDQRISRAIFPRII
jgi:hypothetical protein